MFGLFPSHHLLANLLHGFLNLLGGSIGVLHEGKLIDLRPVDLASNARSPRARTKEGAPQPMPPVTAAELAFNEDFGPVALGDGGIELLGIDPYPVDDDDSSENIPW